MNTLSFVVEPLNPPTQMTLVATPCVDDTPLTELVAEFESRVDSAPNLKIPCAYLFLDVTAAKLSVGL